MREKELGAVATTMDVFSKGLKRTFSLDTLSLYQSKIEAKGDILVQDIDYSDAEFSLGCTLLCACFRNNVEIVEKMVKENPSLVDFSDYDKRTVLHVAASEGCSNIVTFLLNNGAPHNRSDRWGDSPVDDAMRHGHKDIERLLRSRGLNPATLMSRRL